MMKFEAANVSSVQAKPVAQEKTQNHLFCHSADNHSRGVDSDWN